MVKDKIYFASDVHLGSSVPSDPLVTEKRFVRWLDSIKEDAKALYLLGDIFDFWFEYKKVVPKGFTRTLGKLAELNDNGTEIHFFTGNHDIWAFDYLPREIGAVVHTEPLTTTISGKTFYLAHGDGLGDNSRSFQIIRSIFRNRICQKLFAAFPSRWGIAFAHRWSAHSRKKALAQGCDYFGEDKEHLVLYAKAYFKTHPDIDFFLFGHRHILFDLLIPPQTRIIILGDWLSLFSYAVFDGKELKLETFEG